MDKQKLPKGWKEVELGEVGQIVTGSTPPKKNPEYYGNSVPWIKPPDLDNGMYVSNSKEKISDLGRSKVRLLPEGSVIVSCIGIIGKVAISKCEICTNQQINSIIPNKEIADSKFLYYLIKKMKPFLEKQGSSAVVPLLNKSEFSRIKIPIPPLATQKAIVSILEKAEKSKEWRKEADDLTDDLLNSIFFNMFGSARNNTKGFDIKGFLDVFDITTGKLDSNASVEGGKYPFFTCSRETFKINDYSFDCEALLLAGNNAAGKYSVKHYKGKFDAYQRTYVLTLKNKDELFSFYHYQLERKLAELQNKSIGTNTKYLTMGILRDIKMICPSTPLQNKFAFIVKEVESLKLYQKKSSQEINNLFNALMQKAFKGELKI